MQDNEKKIRIATYMLIVLLIINGVVSVLRGIRDGRSTAGLIFTAAVLFLFIYFVLERKQWVYKFFIIINILVLCLFVIFGSVLYLLSGGALISYVIIGLCYYLLHLNNPKKYKAFKIPGLYPM